MPILVSRNMENMYIVVYMYMFISAEIARQHHKFLPFSVKKFESLIEYGSFESQAYIRPKKFSVRETKYNSHLTLTKSGETVYCLHLDSDVTIQPNDAVDAVNIVKGG